MLCNVSMRRSYCMSTKTEHDIGWNGGRLIAVCLTAIWPSYARMKNTFGSDMPTTTDQFVGFVIFWFLSTPFLWLRPEKFKIPFLIVCVWCGCGMLAWSKISLIIYSLMTDVI